MAPTPTHPRAPRRDGTDSARPYHNAHTNAGVNRHQGSRTATRGRGTHRRHCRNGDAPVAAPIRATLASRMTYGDTGGRNDMRAPVNRLNANEGDDNDMSTRVNAASNHSSLFFDPQPAGSPSPHSLHRPTHRPPPAPIHMINELLPRDPLPPPKRPINTYRGKDPIKRLCQNKKLQAILAGKPIPKERQKVAGDRMMLRMGVNGVAK